MKPNLRVRHKMSLLGCNLDTLLRCTPGLYLSTLPAFGKVVNVITLCRDVIIGFLRAIFLSQLTCLWEQRKIMNELQSKVVQHLHLC